MDLSSDRLPVSGINGPIELIVAYGHRFKLHRVNSKDKLNSAFLTNTTDQEKKRSTSKLPIVKKGYPNIAKNPFKPNEPLATSGDSIAGPSKAKSLPPRIKRPTYRNESEKMKPSHIPRRKAGAISSPKCERKPDSNYFATDTQRIQRLQVPNIPDFHQEDSIPTTSIGSSRPIPTLGQIYRPNNVVIDGDRFYDWFMELDTPVNSLESNPRDVRRASTDSTDTAQSVINVEINKACFGENEKPKVVFGANVYKTTNDNVSDWLTGDLEYPNRDNESGYRSMSPHSRGAINIESKRSDDHVKQTDQNYCLASTKISVNSKPNEREGALSENNIVEPFQKASFEPSNTTVQDMPLVEQPTVVISRVPEGNETESVQTKRSTNTVDQGLEPIVICKSEFSKNLQFPSISGGDLKDEKQAFAPSYVECPSEILQKTTNFEGDGLESPKTLSSLACTDLEIRDDYSSQYTLENVDDCSLLEDQASAVWCPECRSQSCMTFVKSEESENTALQNSLCNCLGSKNNGTLAVAVADSESRVLRDKRKYCRLCGRKNSPGRRDAVRKYCKKHSRYRRFPSYRYRITRPFDTLRKRLSITRICRHRWNHVWKKTAARWNHWSKSPAKLGKFRMLEYLQSSVIWEDVNVQTLTLVYREIGTHTNIMQQKSAGISASINKSNSAKKVDTGGVATSARSFKSRFKHINMGPSRFPFFNSKRKSMPLKKVEETSKTVHRFFSYPENQNKFVEAIESKRSNRAACLCEDTLQRSIANTSPINFQKFRTMEQDFEKEVQFKNSMDNKLTSTSHSLQTTSCYKPKDACTQVLLTFSNMETDVSFGPVIEHHSSGNVKRNLSSSKPCGMNTDSINLETTPVEKCSIQVMTSGYTCVPSKAEGTPVSTKTSSIKKASVKISTSGQTLDETTKTDLSTETAPPCLICTEANIVSISSAQMLPVSVVTSPTDLPPAGACNPVSTISFQCNTSPSLTCHCNDPKEITIAPVLQVNKSSASPAVQVEDRSIGSSTERFLYEKTTSTLNYDTDFKESKNLSTQALINQWCQSQILVDTGTTPVPLEKKSTSVFAFIDQKSAYAVTSVTKGRSEDVVRKSEICTLKRASIATNTGSNVKSQSIGQSSPDVFSRKSLPTPTIDTWVQHSHLLEQNDKYSHRSARIGHSKLISLQSLNKSSRVMMRRPYYDNETDPILPKAPTAKSIAVMTSGPIDEASNTNELAEARQDVLLCGCAQVGCDMETNTLSDLKIKQNAECSTQIYQGLCKQNSDKCSSCDDYVNRPTCSAFNQRSTAEQLMTLSRLIGHPKSSQMASDVSTALSSNLDAAKWIKRCANEDREYQTLLDIEQSTLDTLKQTSLSIANSSRSTKSAKKTLRKDSKSKPSVLCSLNKISVPTLPPAIGIMSDDSLADVLPISSATKKLSQPNNQKKMTDNFTSDEVILKPLKESILQTCPEISDAATDTMESNSEYLKSASVLTSKCVLPSPSFCSQGNENSECLFVYDKPHCAVHKQRIDASVQISVGHACDDCDKDIKSREHAIDQMECEVIPSRIPSHDRKNTSQSPVAEVLPPKVYKALYETTKMVVKDSKMLSVGDTGLNCAPDIENEALIKALAIRSAGILTSHCGLAPANNCQCNLLADPTVKREYVFAYDTPRPSLEDSTQTCSNCHARLLDIPTYFESDYVGEQVKTQLVGSCRYYSNLLTKRLGRVKEQVTKHLAPSTEQCLYFSAVPKLSYTEACTMKPSGREDLGCQTVRNHVPSHHKPEFSRPMSCCALAPSLTNICGGTDKNHLKSVYYMLSAIEGRIRRLKRNIPN